MTNRTRVLIGLLVAALLVVSAPMVAYAGDDDRGSRSRLDVVAVTADSRLIEFESDDPGDADTIGTISGLTGDSTIVGIDYRPRNGKLYGLGNQGGIYTLSDRTALATKTGQLTVALAGTSFGVDFNPAADALRIVSDTGQNLRVPFAGGEVPGTTATDTSLTYPPAPATGVTGVGYTNNDNEPNTGTTLFDLDSMLDQAVVQSPANSGQLVTTGKLGVDTNATIGFDVYSAIRKGTTTSVRAFASLTVDGRARFYRVNLLQGRASSLGAFSTRNQVTGIAIQLDQGSDKDD
jgi:Domain of unknown function (DUF4394)